VTFGGIGRGGVGGLGVETKVGCVGGSSPQ
jgi:hypothetical protein